MMKFSTNIIIFTIRNNSEFQIMTIIFVLDNFSKKLFSGVDSTEKLKVSLEDYYSAEGFQPKIMVYYDKALESSPNKIGARINSREQKYPNKNLNLTTYGQRNLQADGSYQ